MRAPPGVRDRRLRAVDRRTPGLERDTPPFGEGLPTGFRVRDAVWLEPTMVCEVAFMEWTGHGHIRHPSYQGLRPDKEAGEVVREVEGKVPTVPKRLR